MRKLFHFLKPYTFLIIITCLFLLFQSIGNLSLPLFLSNIIDQGITTGNISYILRIGLYMMIASLITSISGIIAMLTSAKVAMAFGKDLRGKVFNYVQDFSLNEVNQFGTSSLITRTTNDVYQVQQLVVIGLRMMVTAPLMAIGGTVMALYKNASLSLILLVAIPILALLVFLIGKQTLPLYRSMQTKLDQVNLVLRENLVGIRVIRAFNRTPYETKRFDKASFDLTSHAIRVNKLMALLMPGIMLILNITSVAVLWFGSVKIDQGQLLVGDLIAFLQYVMQIMFSLVMLTMVFVLIPKALASANRIVEVIDTPYELTDPQTPVTNFPLKGTLEFKDVSFAYPGSKEAMLNHISFVTKPGEVTAIIGGTGSGKSTLLNLIPRFYEASSGEILIDGVSIQNISLHELHEKIGYVPQKAFLFKGTITENLSFGKPDATSAELTHALEIAQSIDFVSHMPQGINSQLSQGATNLSGGQKQRLAISRALVKKPEIYLFDDSFSALDFKTDYELRKALKKEVTDSAMIIVGQRISSIMDATTILVLDQGKIVGKGTHTELLQNCPLYLEIAQSQLSQKELQEGLH